MPSSNPAGPRAGDIVHITRQASCQFVKSFMFRVIRVHDWPTYDGWMWLDGYQLNPAGNATERRSLFVRQEGLKHAVERARYNGTAATTR